MEYQYQHSRGLQLDMSGHVKNLLFQEIAKALELAYSAKKEEDDKKKEEEKKNEEWISDVVRKRRPLDEALGFVPEFQEFILTCTSRRTFSSCAAIKTFFFENVLRT